MKAPKSRVVTLRTVQRPEVVEATSDDVTIAFQPFNEPHRKARITLTWYQVRHIIADVRVKANEQAKYLNEKAERVKGFVT